MWILFNGDEEGTDGEDGSTCANVRFGIGQCLLKRIGVALTLHWRRWNTRDGDALIRHGHVYRVPEVIRPESGSTSNLDIDIATVLLPRPALIFTQGSGTETVNIQSE